MSDLDTAAKAADTPLAEDKITLPEDEGGDKTTLNIKGYRRRTALIELAGDYAGMWVKTWLNCPRKLMGRLGSSDEKIADQAFADFIVDHNLRYEDGTELPHPITAEAAGGLDIILSNKIIKLGAEAIQKAAGLDPR